ncbi:hypothetical protein HG530_014916 [Fusarium avenaceum]|nr:hypothetical protein HG530_014916 [Fusarium avenaceum]
MLRGVTSTNDCRGEADTNGNLCTITGGACDGNLRRGAGSLVIWLSGALKPRNGIFAGAVTCVTAPPAPEEPKARSLDALGQVWGLLNYPAWQPFGFVMTLKCGGTRMPFCTFQRMKRIDFRLSLAAQIATCASPGPRTLKASSPDQQKTDGSYLVCEANLALLEGSHFDLLDHLAKEDLQLCPRGCIGEFFGFVFLGTIIGVVLSSVDHHLLVFICHFVDLCRIFILGERDRLLGFDHHFFVGLVYVSRRNDMLFHISPLRVTFDCLFLHVLDDILVFVLLNSFGVVFLGIHDNILVLLFA